jgi:hypothetical protein
MNINGSDVSRPDINTTHMGTTNYQTYIPGKLVEGGAIELEINFDPDATPPITGVAETITITFPLPSGGITPADVEFTGYINSWSWADPMEEKMTADVSIKVDGLTDPVWTAST